MACRYLWTPLDSDIEVYGDANFAGCISQRKSPVGGIIMWSGQFVKAWSKTMGVLALSSGESELAAAVRAATQGLEDRHATESSKLPGPPNVFTSQGPWPAVHHHQKMNQQRSLCAPRAQPITTQRKPRHATMMKYHDYVSQYAVDLVS